MGRNRLLLLKYRGPWVFVLESKLKTGHLRIGLKTSYDVPGSTFARVKTCLTRQRLYILQGQLFAGTTLVTTHLIDRKEEEVTRLSVRLFIKS